MNELTLTTTAFNLGPGHQATYHHLPDRDLDADLKKASRKWNNKPRNYQVPAIHPGMGQDSSVLTRTIDHYSAKLGALTDPAHIVVLTLFKPTKPMGHKFNYEIELWARRHPQLLLAYVDPADWGVA